MTEPEKPLSPSEEEARAIGRIAASGDGRLLHRYLRRVLEFVGDFPDPGTLQVQNGRRTLARDLMRLMAEGIEQSAGSADQPILAAQRGPISVRARRRPGSRLVEPDQPVAGYDAPDAEPAGSNANGAEQG